MSGRVLIVSGHEPDPEGAGPQRRLAATLRALNPAQQVTLLLVGVAEGGPRPASTGPEGLRVVVVPPPRPRGPARWRASLARRHPILFSFLCGRPGDWPHTPWLTKRAVAALAGYDYDLLHVFRLGMAPVALALAQAGRDRPKLHLDLDDLEARTHQRIADLATANGDTAMAGHYRSAARVLQRLERRWLPGFSRVYVCSETDRQALAHPGGRVLPNTCALPLPRPRAGPASPYRVLFLGSLGYYPNEDALRFVRTQLAPVLQGGDVELLCAGFGTGRRLAPLLTESPGFRYLGRLPSSAEAFARTDSVIVPLRAGGGTRLKILEAFAHGCPVISTPIGIEGIAAQPDLHYLPAESAEDFARQIRRLVADPELGARLALAARDLIAQNYSPAAVEAALAP